MTEWSVSNDERRKKRDGRRERREQTRQERDECTENSGKLRLTIND